MCLPFALVTALILLVTEFMRALIRLMGILFHSSSRALVNLARVAGGGWRCQTYLSNWSHRCSVVDKSGLYGGRSSGWMLLFARKTCQILATWGLALSCCRVRLCCCKKGITWGRWISSLSEIDKGWIETHLWRKLESTASVETVVEHVLRLRP